MKTKKRVNILIGVKEHALAKERGLNISKICQLAIENEVYEDNIPELQKKHDEIFKKRTDELSTIEAKILIAKAKKQKKQEYETTQETKSESYPSPHKMDLDKQRKTPRGG